MNSSNVDRRVRRAAGHIERLEQRQLLSATLLSQIPTQPVAAGQSGTVDLGTYFKDPTVPGTAVLMTTPLGNIPIALATSTPKTDANFISYITNGEYSKTMIQRSVPGFVLQGGGYMPDGTPLPANDPVQSEAGISNTAGTIAMALSTGPNSGTNQWFINLGDNSQSLDGAINGGPFTVFGNVIYNGMTVVNAIAGEPVIDGSNQTPALEQQNVETGGMGPWSALPVLNYTGQQIAGSTIAAAGNLGNISSTDLNASDIYAGTIDLAGAGQVLPNFASDFATIQSIASVKLRGIPGGNAFSLSDIAAADIGRLSLGSVLTSNNGNPTGIAAESIKSLGAVIGGKHANLKNVTDPTQLATVLSDLGVDLGDFVIKIF